MKRADYIEIRALIGAAFPGATATGIGGTAWNVTIGDAAVRIEWGDGWKASDAGRTTGVTGESNFCPVVAIRDFLDSVQIEADKVRALSGRLDALTGSLRGAFGTTPAITPESP